jgi:hypothetical protein
MPEQLQQIFQIGSELKEKAPVENENQHKENILRHRLAEVLPLDDEQIKMLPDILGQFCQTLGMLAGETIFSLLRAPTTDLELIRKIKKHSKELSRNAKSKAEHDIAAALYYASIAHALAFHDLRITKFSYKQLENTFSRLINEKWMIRELAVLFKIAQKQSEQQMKKY